MLLSIIIPLYNCAAYVERCILSIYDQGLNIQDFEVIAINDGSIDGGEKIVEKLARTRPNLILLNQENKGLSAVRNRGVEVARGRYVEFLDADDYLIPCGMSRSLKTAVDNEVDILVFKTKKVEDTIALGLPEPEEVLDKNYKVSPVLTGPEAETYESMPEYVFSVNYLFVRRQMYIDHNLRFATDIAFGEDGIVSMQLFINARRVIVTDCLVHRYVKRGSSLCNSREKKTQVNRIRCYKKAAIEFHRINEAHKDRSLQGYDLYRQRINLFIFFYLYGAMKDDIPNSELKAGIKELREHGLYPIGTFERFGYSGFKNKCLIAFCKTGGLFTLTHRILHLFR